MKSKKIEALGLLLAIGLSSNRLPACGPDFPNNLLENGGEAVLVAPMTDFYRELDRLHLAPARFHAVTATNNYAEQNIALEQADLLAALKKSGVNGFEAGQIATAHLAERMKLQQFNADLKEWSNSAPADWSSDTQKFVHGQPAGQPPKFPVINIVAGLPEEFGDYFDGAIAWYNPLIMDKATCRQMWERLLELPPPQRHFKSVAATFMLGKAWAEEDPDKSASYFQQVRTLTKHGFTDSAGLAAASLGEEARLDLVRKQFVSAINLYLEQLATGDLTAANSLRFAAARALNTSDDNGLNQLAIDAHAQRVITAYLISGCRSLDLDRNLAVKKWLGAVEAANVREVASAETFALAAYQIGECDLAQRWIDLAPDSPTAQWLQVKLLLRAGKLDDAAALLATVSHSFPVEPPTTNAPATLAENLTVADFSGNKDAPRQMLGELGVLHLARREYTEALDALLRAGFWMDAAYVAERVLTVDELKSYVDADWPAVPEKNHDSNNFDGEGSSENESINPCGEIRYLLGRRLTRLDRSSEATVYYPVEWQSAQASLTQTLATGRNESLSAQQRFYALTAAARITRTNGMELIGTEVAPDWHIYDGNFEGGVEAKGRTQGLLPADKDELSRAAQNDVMPETRWHYRDQANLLKVEAAKLGWEAAGQMPDNSDETALVLCRSGSWLDPKNAAPYYQAILKRCRQTEIGEETARIGSFPKLDENGYVIRRTLNAEDSPVPGKRYAVHAGDTLFHIAATVSANGQPTTVADLLQANRRLTTGKIRTGQTIQIPVVSPTETDQLMIEPASQPGETDPSSGSVGQAASGNIYVIQSGDSLIKIAQAASELAGQISVQDILDTNPDLASNGIKVGQIIVIPAPKNKLKIGTSSWR